VSISICQQGTSCKSTCRCYSVVCICNFTDALVGFHSDCHNPVIDSVAAVDDSFTRWQCRVCIYRQTASPVSKLSVSFMLNNMILPELHVLLSLWYDLSVRCIKCFNLQLNLVISNSDNSNFRLYRGRTLVPGRQPL